jgi:ParB family transcriptional regulator, chromosome partitioning protein
MNRRAGLGRGLGALIATNVEAAKDAEQEVTASVPDDAPAAAPEAAAPEADVSGTTTLEPEAVDVVAGTGDGVPSSTQTLAGVGAAVLADGRARLIELDPTKVARNPRQPRDVFDQEEIDQLATSLLDVGMLQPLVVRPLDADRYELVAGERRLRAALVAGLPLVPAIVRRTEDADLLKEALVENIHRVQLNPLEEAAAYQQLLEDFGVTQEELASRLGRSRPTISNTIRLLSLPPGVQRRVAAGVLSAGHAKALLSLEGPAAQSRLADRIVAEGLSVRATEEAARLLVADAQDTTTATTSGRSGARRVTIPALVDLQDDLSDALEARVRISMGARRGKLTIEFLSVDDLERIVGVIADGLGADAPAGTQRGSLTGGLSGGRSSDASPAFADDLGDVDLDEIRRATDLSDLEDD